MSRMRSITASRASADRHFWVKPDGTTVPAPRSHAHAALEHFPETQGPNSLRSAWLAGWVRAIVSGHELYVHTPALNEVTPRQLGKLVEVALEYDLSRILMDCPRGGKTLWENDKP